MKVVIVDDEPLVRVCLKSYLDWESMGLSIVGEAQDGEQALELINALHPDIVLLDIKMPKLNGLEVLRQLFQSKLDTKVVMLSSFNEFEMVREALRLNAFDYIHKPTMTVSDLTQTLKTVITVIQKGKSEEEMLTDTAGKEQLLIKQHLLKEALCGNEMAADELDTMLEGYNIHLPSEGLVCVLFKMNDYSFIKTRYQAEGSQRISTAIFNLVAETCRSEQGWELVRMDDNLYALLLSTAAGGAVAREKSALLERLVLNTRQFLSAELVMGCSSRHAKPQLSLAYREGLSALNHSFFQPEKNVIYYYELAASPLESPVRGDYDATSDLLKKMQSKLELMDISAAISYFDAIVEQVRSSSLQNGYNQAYSINLFAYIYFIVDGHLNSLHFENAFHFSFLYQELLQASDIKQLAEMLRSMLVNLSAYMEENNHKFTASTQIAQAMQYIQQNYASQFSLDDVAGVVGLNKSYFSRVFKEQVGISFVNYVNQYRIDIAAKLLKATEQKTYEIAYSVGYNNVEYFNQVFKKLKGCPPSDFR